MVTTIKDSDGGQQGEVEISIDDDGFLIVKLRGTEDDTELSLALDLGEAVNVMASLATAIQQMAH